MDYIWERSASGHRTHAYGTFRRTSVSEEITIDENGRSHGVAFYSLMSADPQDMDPETSLQLYHTYVMPVLNYGLEVYWKDCTGS